MKKEESSLKLILNYTIVMVALAFVILVPLVMKDGYSDIDTVKFSVYKYIFMFGYGLVLILALFDLLKEADNKNKTKSVRANGEVNNKVLAYIKNIDTVTALAIGYLGVCLLSSIISPYDSYCFWGVTGWNMGFFAQLSFVMILLLHRRYDKYNMIILYGMLATSFLVILFGILHRFDVDPLNTYRIGTVQEMESGFRMRFLSTIGQATWYSSYVMPMLALGFGLYIYTEKRNLRIIMAFYSLCGCMTLVTQNSDSAYVAFAGIMSVYFVLCLSDKERRKRFLFLLCYFVIATRIINLCYSSKELLLEYDTISSFLLFNTNMWWITAIVILMAVLNALFDRRYEVKPKTVSIIRRIFIACIAIFIVSSVLILILDAAGVLPEKVVEMTSKIHYLHWSQYWGSGRGCTWEFSWKMFRNMDFAHKLFGVGPDMFAFEGYTNYGEELAELWPGDIVACAHNEFLNLLITTGILGVLTYIGIFAAVIYSAQKLIRKAQDNNYPVSQKMLHGKREGKNKKSPTGQKTEIDYTAMISAIIIASVVAYLCNNFFSYQQVCCTPFIFLIMGLAPKMMKQD